MNKKNIISLLVLAILAVAIPLGLNLARQQQTLKSSATEAPISFSGDNAEQRNGVWVVKDRTKPVTVTFTSPLGPPPVVTGPAILRSVQSPIKKKVTFSFPSLVKEVYAANCSADGGLVKKGNCDRRSMEATWSIPNVYGSCNIFIQGGNRSKFVSHECRDSGVPINTFPDDNNDNAPLHPDGVYALFVSNGKGDPDNCDGSDAQGNVEIGRVSFDCPAKADGRWSGWTPDPCPCGGGTQTRTCTPQTGGGRPCSEIDGGNNSKSCTRTCDGGNTGGGSCSVSWQISPAQASPNTNVSVTVTGGNSSVSGGWLDIGLSVDNGASVGDAQITPGSQPRFTYTVGSGAQPRTNTLTFSLRNGSKACTPTGSFTTTGGSTTATVDIKANGSADSITIDHNASANLTWTSSTNITSCTASGTWSGSKPANGNESTGALSGPSTKTYTLNCTGSGVTASDSVVVTVHAAPAAKECDFNGNNEYDDGDIDLWKGSFLGVPGNQARGPDCNRDGSIDLLDFNKWRNLRWHGSEGS